MRSAAHTRADLREERVGNCLPPGSQQPTVHPTGQPCHRRSPTARPSDRQGHDEAAVVETMMEKMMETMTEKM